MRTLKGAGHCVIGLDVLPSAFTHVVGSITNRALVAQCMRGVNAVLHTATLHKPHVATHTAQAFVDTNVTGTLTLLEEAVAAEVGAFVFTSTTSTFGDALTPAPGAPAAWITEEVKPVPKNIYGASKTAAEDLCQLFARNHGLPCTVLRTSRFFPEQDDNAYTASAYADANAKTNEFLYRRVDIEDVVSAHLLAAAQAPSSGFDRFIISATTPFVPSDLADLRADAPAVLARIAPECAALYAKLGWRMFPEIDRVYVNTHALTALGWTPRYDFGQLLHRLAKGHDPRSPLALKIGCKGYHRTA